MSESKQIIEVTSFDDLVAPDTVPLAIEVAHRPTIQTVCGVLSFDEWEEAARKIVRPNPPKNLENPKRPGEFLPNPADEKHLDDLREWNTNRLCYQVIVALERGGVIKIPGTTPKEKVKAFRKLDNATYTGLILGVLKIHGEQKAVLEDLADSFRQQPTQPTSDDGNGTVEHQDESGVVLASANGAG